MELYKTAKQDFIFNARVIAEKIHDIAKEHGFWCDEPTSNFGLKIALIHSELSEALDAHRNGTHFSETIPNHLDVTEELADAIIRIFDLAEHEGYDLCEAIISKIDFNETRPFKHGKIY